MTYLFRNEYVCDCFLVRRLSRNILTNEPQLDDVNILSFVLYILLW